MATFELGPLETVANEPVEGGFALGELEPLQAPPPRRQPMQSIRQTGQPNLPPPHPAAWIKFRSM